MTDDYGEAEIFVRLRVPGFHHWPGAPGSRAYLAAPHRHLFHLVVSMPVRHSDREVEFHDLLDEVKALFPGGFDHGARSCETMATDIARTLSARHDRPVTVEVSEDGEAGARVTTYED